jgi:hypothetical protein
MLHFLKNVHIVYIQITISNACCQVLDILLMVIWLDYSLHEILMSYLHPTDLILDRWTFC